MGYAAIHQPYQLEYLVGTRSNEGMGLDLETVILAGIGILILFAVVRGVYSEHVRTRQLACLRQEAIALTRPVVQHAYTSLTTEIAQLWPLIPFEFLSMESLLSDVSQTVKSVRQSPNHRAFAWTALSRLIDKAILDYLTHTSEIQSSSVSDREHDAQEYSFTPGGRNPPDWAERRRVVYERDNGRCVRCGFELELEHCHIHHVVRRAHGGSHAYHNLVTLCRDCHGLMPGHERVYGGPFYVTNYGTMVHTGDCFHARSARKTALPLPVLYRKGYSLCSKCCFDARGYQLSLEFYVRRRLRELVPKTG